MVKYDVFLRVVVHKNAAFAYYRLYYRYCEYVIMYNRCRDKSLVQAVVGKYDDRPRLRLTAHHRRPKAGPSIQSSQRERNPKGSHRLLCAIAERLGQRLWKTHDCAYTYLADHCDLRKPLCHLYTYNRRSGSLKAHFDVILATTVSYFAAKTSQWS